MGIFGWSYPAGAENDPNAPYNQTDDRPCLVCGKFEDDCICLECPVCEVKGDPACYGEMIHCSWCGVITKTFAKTCILCTNIDQHPIAKPISQSLIEGHGLVRTQAQIDSLEEAESGWAEQAHAEAEYEAKYIAEMERYDEH